MGKNLSNKYCPNFLIVLKNLQRMQQRLLQKEQFEKQQEQLLSRYATSRGRLLKVPKGPNVRDLQGTFRELLSDQQKN